MIICSDHTLKNGALLFKLHVNYLNNGKYKIHIYDENGLGCNINTNFIIGDKYKGKREKYIQPVRFLSARFLLIPFFICLLIIIFPFFPFFTIQKIKEIEESIESIKIIMNQ